MDSHDDLFRRLEQLNEIILVNHLAGSGCNIFYEGESIVVDHFYVQLTAPSLNVS